jgi:S-DNA-T family DNA segregation ATPase FtsK/SpoIIIE
MTRRRRAAGVLLLALGLCMGLSFVPESPGGENLIGPLGAASEQVLKRLFAWGGLLLPVLALVWGIVLFRGRGEDRAARFAAVAGAGTLASLTAFAILQRSASLDPVPAAGMLADELALKLSRAFGVAGALVAVALGLFLTLVFFLELGGRREDSEAESPSGPASRTGRQTRWFSGNRLLRAFAQALLWVAGMGAAAVAWLFSWLAGLLGVLLVSLGVAVTRFAARAGPLRGGASGEAGSGKRGKELLTPGSDLVPGSSAKEMTLAGATLPPWPDAPAGHVGSELPSGAARGRRGASSSRETSFPQARRRRDQEPPWEVPLDLLDPAAARDASATECELQELGATLIRKLADFNVRGEVVRISSGPVITQFEVEPAPGIKVNQIANLADDLALAMRAQRIRIVAPIPGKGAVGIEIPNRHPERVTIRELLESRAFREFPGTLPFALGKEISGVPVVADLTRMPHLLIAGSTGSGKSICINALLTSLLYLFSPSHLRLILIDPKMLELSMYNEVPHLLHPVVTRPRDAAVALKWAVYEMERRFELLARNGVRNVGDFNARLRAGAQLEGVDSKLGSADEPPAPLPYVVVVVDELADLMLTVQAEIEDPLARLAQKARAVGIHVVLATQRPSVNVLTGFIKANFPSRISFQVASKTDSRTVLDQNGAEALLGSGDMLFLPADRAVPIRIQGAYVSSRETEALVKTLKELARLRDFAMQEGIDLQKVEGAEADVDAVGERDELFFEAARIVIEHDQGSTSLLQRRLKVGYSRAARIVDQLHEHGIVGPADGSKPREVRIGLEELAEMQKPQAAGPAAGTRSL